MINTSLVVDGLRQTSKGQLEYQREIGGKTLTDLFEQTKEIIDERTEEATLDLTVSFTEKLHAVTSTEKSYDNRSRDLMAMKQQEFLHHQTHLDSWRDEVVSVVQQHHRQDISVLRDSIERKQQSKRPEMEQVMQRVKDTHQRCSRRQEARLRHVEQLSQHLQEEKTKREQALDQKLEEVREMARRITANKTSLVSALDQCPHKQHLTEVAEKTRQFVTRLSEQAEGLAGSLTRTGPLEDMLAKLKQFHEQTQKALDFVHNLTGRVWDRQQCRGETKEIIDERTEEATLDLTVSFTEKLHAVTSMEKSYDNQSRDLMAMKQQEFLHHQTHLDSWRDEVVSVVQQHHCQDISVLRDSIERKQQSKRPEMEQVMQRVKETHRHCARRQEARLRHVEQLSQHLQEEKTKREQALDQKLEEVRAMAGRITANKTSLVNALDQCPHKQHLTEEAEKTRQFVTRLSEQAEGLAGSLTRTGPLEDVLAKLKQFHEQTQNALDFVHNLTGVSTA